jgi:predicted amidohydrolase YtcJ
MKFFYLFALILVSFSCMKGKKVDLIVHNAKIYSIDNGDRVYEAMAIKDGKIVELGPERQILNKYRSDETIDANGKDVYPGLSDAHGHILSLLDQKLTLDLTGTKSFEEILFKTEKYASKSSRKFIVARGWDQSLWANQEFPTNEKLNKLFPSTPVLLIRVDGHAALANDFLLRKAQLNANSNIEGGKIISDNGIPTGLILDNAINEVTELIPPFSLKEKQKAILEIQEELFQLGITSVHEAGINFEDIQLFESLISQNKLDLNIYAMLYPSPENMNFVKKNGHYKNKNLSIRSFKVVGDGSLGSRGACLKKPYSDDIHSHGFLTTSLADFKKIAAFCRLYDYQMNTHAIGDSTNKIILDVIDETNKTKKDHRWRIEHAQVLDVNDIKRLASNGAFPSVQPTHAVSDQRWAEQRLGRERLKGAYAYKSLLAQTGIIAFGTDFPVESFNPFLTIHAAVQRKNEANSPSTGFLSSEAVNFQECMKAMTLWPAFACFQEKTTGSLEKGKDATFVIFDYPLNSNGTYSQNFAFMTFIKGKKVYSAE